MPEEDPAGSKHVANVHIKMNYNKLTFVKVLFKINIVTCCLKARMLERIDQARFPIGSTINNRIAPVSIQRKHR
jgi:hypothetical protein